MLGAWGLGWEVWLDGMEVTQFTYFQQVRTYTYTAHGTSARCSRQGHLLKQCAGCIVCGSSWKV